MAYAIGGKVLIDMEHVPSAPIGVFDSGVGGLTVLRELRKLLPGEDFIYYGDNANNPIGNKSEEELTQITGRIFRFFRSRRVKLAVAACNTTSALIDKQGMPDYGFYILSVIEPIARQVAKDGLGEVGLLATVFTVGSGCYTRLIHKADPSIGVYAQASRELAGLIERGRFEGEEIPGDIRTHLDALLAERPLEHIILGCTHYPIVQDVFQRLAPGVNFLDPAVPQAREAKERLAAEGLLNPAREGTVEICTSGETALFREIVDHMGITGVSKIHRVDITGY